MKPLSTKSHLLMSFGLIGKNPLAIIFLIMAMGTSLLSGCSSDKKKDRTPYKDTNEQTDDDTNDPSDDPDTTTDVESSDDEKNGYMMVTFSVSNDLMDKYPHLKLGLYEIEAQIRADNAVLKHRVYGTDPQVDAEVLTEVTPLELTSLKEGMHLYQGTFKVPAGKLETVRVEFSGGSSAIAMGDTALGLIDPFGFSYTGDHQRLPSRLFASTVHAQADIDIEKDEMHVIDIALDANMSVGKEPFLENTGLFTPTIRISEMSSPFDAVIHQVDGLEIDENTIYVSEFSDDSTGETRDNYFITEYSLGADAKLFVNAESVESLELDAQLANMTLMGSFTPGVEKNALTIESATVHSLAVESDAGLYTGMVTVSGDTFSLKGYKYPLSEMAGIVGSVWFDGTITGSVADLELVDGSMVTLWSDDTETKLLMTHEMGEMESNRALTIRASVFNTPADLLSLRTAALDETMWKSTLSEALPCEDFVRMIGSDDSACTGDLTSLTFTLANEGSYSILETRRAEQLDVGGEVTYNVLEDQVMHFTSMGDFVAELAMKVSDTDEGRYRLAALLANGEVADSGFEIGSVAKVILLQPQAELDARADAHQTEVVDENTGWSSRQISLVALGGATAAIAAAFLGKKVFDIVQSRNKRGLVEARIVSVQGIEVEFTARDLGGNLQRFRAAVPSGVNLADVEIDATGALRATLTNAQGERINANGSRIAADASKSALVAADGTAEGRVTLAPLADTPEFKLFSPTGERQPADFRIYLLAKGETDGNNARPFDLNQATAKELGGGATSYEDPDGNKIRIGSDGTLTATDGSRIAITSDNSSWGSWLRSFVGGATKANATYTDSLENVDVRPRYPKAVGGKKTLSVIYNEHLSQRPEFAKYRKAVSFDDASGRYVTTGDDGQSKYLTHIDVEQENTGAKTRYVFSGETGHVHPDGAAIPVKQGAIIKDTPEGITLFAEDGEIVRLSVIEREADGTVNSYIADGLERIDTYGASASDALIAGADADDLEIERIHETRVAAVDDAVKVRKAARAEYPVTGNKVVKFFSRFSVSSLLDKFYSSSLATKSKAAFGRIGDFITAKTLPVRTALAKRRKARR